MMGPNGLMPLHVACAMGHSRIVRLLLAYGADVDAADELGQTALHFAAELGALAELRLLCAYGADPECQTVDGRGLAHIVQGREAQQVAQVVRAVDEGSAMKGQYGVVYHTQGASNPLA